MDSSSQYSQPHPPHPHTGQHHQSPPHAVQGHHQSPPGQAPYMASAPGYDIKNEPGGPSPPHSYGAQQHHNGQQYYNGSGQPPAPPGAPAPTPGPTYAGTMPVTQLVTTVTHEPPSHSMIQLGRRYAHVLHDLPLDDADHFHSLDVVQQPQRARMCGFGDKDRRPITPPPCIRLIITDAQTGNEIDVNDIDFGLFVLNVDLWSADGLREVNLVRHSASATSPAAAVIGSYATAGNIHAPIYVNPLPIPTGHPSIVRDPQFPYHHNPPSSQTSPNEAQPYNPFPQQPQVNPYSQSEGEPPRGHYAQPFTPTVLPQHSQSGTPGYAGRPASPVYNPPSRFADPPNHHVYYHTGNTVHAIASNTVRPTQYDQPANPANPNQPMPPASIASSIQPTTTATGMFTRNLIGSLAASAFRLTDPSDKVGIWFVLQDLSVRTEGNFRLRFSFVNVGQPGRTPNGNPSNQISIINGDTNPDGTPNGRGRAPILASCYSDVFTVFSAKKFPGVVESTGLSRCFAQQGIKIPIRKDGPGKGGGREEYDED